MNEGLISLVVILLPLSFISERLTNFLKLIIPSDWFGNLKDRENNLGLEKKRELKILSISLLSGMIVAYAVKADLFAILNQGTIGWGHGTKGLLWILGCFATGIFLSWGSKFWHDLLDMLLEIKNARKALSETKNTEARMKRIELAGMMGAGAPENLAIEEGLIEPPRPSLTPKHDIPEDGLTMQRLSLLHPDLRLEVMDIYREIRERGVSIRVTDTLRTMEEQNALYAKGRTAPGRIVTHAKSGQSYHNYGLALDFCLMMDGGRQVSWDRTLDLDGDQLRDWDEVVGVFKHYGWEWGGDWTRFKDYPHFQKTFGLSTAELRRRWADDQFTDDKKNYVKL